jgi:DUF1680 family protein
MIRNLVGLIVVSILMVVAAQAQGNSGKGAVALKVEPAFETIPKAQLKLGGFVGRRLQANLENWELRAPDSNPALVEMFYDRDRKPDRRLPPWSGEFVGKYLCSSILSYRLLRDPRQKAMIDRITRAFLNSQGADGYLGPFDGKNRLTGDNWDIWGHYWDIRALLMVHEELGSPEALQAATRAADLLVSTFLNKGIHLTNDGNYGQMNYAVIHAFTQLYVVTGKPEYLEMARWVVREWDLPGAGIYMRMALTGHEMFEFPGNRWESLHDFLGMYDMYLLTGEPQFREAFTRIWYSILKGDRHNTGGFTSGERTTGNPYDEGAIETCCTVAWIDMSLAMLKLTGDSLVADELELSTFNGNLGGQNPAGNWWTYNTPMEGTKEASAHTLNGQCRPGSPELNCCSVNGPRGIGMVGEWAVMRSKDGLVLNYYGPSTIRAPTPAGQTLQLEQKTDYPVTGNILLQVVLAKPEKFELKLRIPSWSSTARLTVNGQAVSGVRPGSYLRLQREWENGDTIHLELDSSLHYWAGEREYDGKTSIYHGPLLLAFDPVYNLMDPEDVPELDARNLNPRFEKTDRIFQPWLLVKVKATNGQDVTLCDFATAGAYGNHYRTWLPIKNLAPLAFDPSQPVWNNRPRR